MHDCIVGLGVASGDVVDAAFAVGANYKRRDQGQNKVALKENKQRWRLSLKCSVEVPTCQQEHRLVCLAYQQLGLPLKALYQVP